MAQNLRASRLDQTFERILRGQQQVTPQLNKLFLEAICAQPDVIACVNKIIGSSHGLMSVQASMRFDTSLTFLNDHATKLIAYIQAPELKVVSGGTFLDQIVSVVVNPPIFWKAFFDAFLSGKLQEDGCLSFGWLLLHLISQSGESASQYRDIANIPTITNTLIQSSRSETRAIGQKIKHILSTFNSGAPADTDTGPGGRHDNDFVDFRQISVLPTADEIMSTEKAFIRMSASLEDPETEPTRVADYLDNQYRMLREDMLYEMREELQIALRKKKGFHRGLVVEGFKLLDVHCGAENRRCKWGVTLKCAADLPQLKGVKPKDRKDYLDKNRKIFKHQSLACLLVDDEITAFPTINRDEDLLALNPPVIVLQLEGEASTVNALLKLKTGQRIKLIQIDTAVFAYEPVLTAIKEIKEIPLSPELLFWNENSDMRTPPLLAKRVIEALQSNPGQDLKPLLGTTTSIRLDGSQAASFISGLTQRVSLIQGPPGTGKSFIGSILAKVLHDYTSSTILVVCYTNHALDQFLEDLLNIGIAQQNIVRLGGKSTTKTAPLTLQNTQKAGLKWGRADWTIINNLTSTSESLYSRLTDAWERYKVINVQNSDLLEYLEFGGPEYLEAFRVPTAADGMTQIGKKGRKVDTTYLLNQWVNGWDAGIFMDYPHVRAASQIWGMTRAARQDQIAQWKLVIMKEQVADIYAVAKEYNACQNELARKRAEGVAVILSSKRIIGCTTTAAAKYSVDILAASPDVLLVEEAGEILESHILTALGPKTQQLILIGDHKQLRPKVNHYELTVEKGDGFDLNRSLFERLVLKGYPHQTLTEQHRMRPEISDLIRHLTYPDLVDSPKTANRPDLRGVQDNVVFINHDYPEDNTPELADRKDLTTTSSKQNSYEVEMVLKIVRYLGQQGYGTDKLVVLTPYLGQLQKLQAALKADNDPVLSDLDSYDLVRAGLLPAATAKLSKKPIRLATIDNYQGEESEIVIVSLTRSNAANDIGFMSSPERLNVLLSRARNALIMIGNARTFLNSKKGRDIWTPFIDLLKHGRHVFDGLPVRCERHQDRMALLRQASDFDTECPDGGCTEPCNAKLSCGHECPSKCHQLYDHSKMPCQRVLSSQCPQGHPRTWVCHKGSPVACMKCDKAQKIAEKKRQKDLVEQQKRDTDQALHNQKIAEIEEKIASERRIIRDAQVARERENAIRQKEMDLQDAARAAASSSPTIDTTISSETSPGPTGGLRTIANPLGTFVTSLLKPFKAPLPETMSLQDPKSAKPNIQSSSQQEWQRQKDFEGASNDAIDSIMSMTGLEEVKAQVLRIKAKVDATKRQNSSLKEERFNIVLLGNPGTGKTTVARAYAKFLTSSQVLPGSEFVETTGSRLANDGVPGIKKLIENVINAGGGAIFVDEAYQLAGEHNFQGSQVLDFLLAEMENNVGTIVFILAGYNKQMEKFFEHNPGLTSRVPYTLQFKDYTDSELQLMLEQLIRKKYNGRMKVEDGVHGLYGRIAVRRLGRGRGKEGFGNARALHNMLAKIAERQAERLAGERRKGLTPNDFMLMKEDLIGPNPSQVLLNSASWTKLRSLTGLSAVKESIRSLFNLIEINYQRELEEKEPIQMSLNRVFLGSPGTGKTTVARLYGQILADLGLISNGEVVMKNPADFIGAVLGESEKNTKAILANTIGKVLIIDEAYMLYGGAGGPGKGNDQYKTAVIDTIVAEVQSVPGEDRCVLLLGYKTQIVEMFQNVNPGLSRRFDIENAFHFEDFSDTELSEILDQKLKSQDLEATLAAKKVVIELLGRLRDRPNFGNAGEVENLLGQAKNRYQTRQRSLPVAQRSSDVKFEPQDFDPNFDRGVNASTNLQKLFEDIVGCDDIVKKLGDYQRIAQAMKLKGADSRNRIPTNFVFKGPPGCGKTTVARKFGQIYYDMGFLSSVDVIECSASDLVGQYVGHTGEKTKQLFEKALGHVLFIDEAYRLREGHFAKEAIDELVGLLTQEKFKSKMVVVLAGYTADINQLLSVNTGLSSRFPDEIVFRDMEPSQCLEVLCRELKKDDIQFPELSDPNCSSYFTMSYLVSQLATLPGWGNARDMNTLAQQMSNIAWKSVAEKPDAKLTLSFEDAEACIRQMLIERRERSENLPPSHERPLIRPPVQQMPDAPTPPQIATSSRSATAAIPLPKLPTPKLEEAEADQIARDDDRDQGVTDAVWKQLQADKRSAEARAKTDQEVIVKLAESLAEATQRERRAADAQQNLAKAIVRDRLKEAGLNEARRLQEQMRLKEIQVKAERQRIADALEAKRKEMEQKRQQEEKVQRKLREMGVCVAGYRWIKQETGYRCTGGSHFIANASLGL